jgi:hypothetical protein
MSINKPIIYATNKDLLAEIHKSKISYSSFLTKEDQDFDIIIESSDPEDELSTTILKCNLQENIETAISNRKSRTGNPLITVDDIVFRVMTWDHIPILPKAPKKVDKKKAKDLFEFDDSLSDSIDDMLDIPDELNDMVHAKVNFPPFHHYRFIDGALTLVGKSHWDGDLDTGNFSKDHGAITNYLAKMYIMMAERYAMKYQFRGYTYLDELKGCAILQLTYVGLRFNEARSNNPFSFLTQTIHNSFLRILKSEKKNQNIRDDLWEIAGVNPSFSRQGSGGSFDE